jgi:hypothetical protein
MSIENLNGANFPININNLLTQNIDTPSPGQTLSIGAVNANPINIGQVGTVVHVKSVFQTNNIDTAIPETLFIAPSSATGIAVSYAGGPPLTVSSGKIFSQQIGMGGSLGAGIFTVGGGPLDGSTEVDIANPAIPIKLLGSSLQFPATVNPLVISESRISQTNVLPYVGAIFNVAGANVSVYRFGDWVTVDFRDLLGSTGFTLNVPLTVTAAIPVDYRPVAIRTFSVLIQDNAANQLGQANIFTNGDITIGNALNNNFAGPGNIAVYDFSYTYNING